MRLSLLVWFGVRCARDPTLTQTRADLRRSTTLFSKGHLLVGLRASSRASLLLSLNSTSAAQSRFRSLRLHRPLPLRQRRQHPSTPPWISCPPFLETSTRPTPVLSLTVCCPRTRPLISFWTRLWRSSLRSPWGTQRKASGSETKRSHLGRKIRRCGRFVGGSTTRVGIDSRQEDGLTTS